MRGALRGGLGATLASGAASCSRGWGSECAPSPHAVAIPCGATSTTTSSMAGASSTLGTSVVSGASGGTIASCSSTGARSGVGTPAVAEASAAGVTSVVDASGTAGDGARGGEGATASPSDPTMDPPRGATSTLVLAAGILPPAAVASPSSLLEDGSSIVKFSAGLEAPRSVFPFLLGRLTSATRSGNRNKDENSRTRMQLRESLT
jgi:hypothetical protein